MGPIEYFFLLIGVMITAIGVARKYNNELGNSIIFMFTISALGVVQTQFAGQFQRLVDVIQSVLGGTSDQWGMLFFAGLFIIVVIMSYTGITFIYGLNPRKGFLGALFTLTVALFDGWLVAGTIWYYSAKFNYPFFPIVPDFTSTAQTIVNGFLPQTVFGGFDADPVIFPVYWLIPPTILLILRVRG